MGGAAAAGVIGRVLGAWPYWSYGEGRPIDAPAGRGYAGSAHVHDRLGLRLSILLGDSYE